MLLNDEERLVAALRRSGGKVGVAACELGVRPESLTRIMRGYPGLGDYARELRRATRAKVRARFRLAPVRP